MGVEKTKGIKKRKIWYWRLHWILHLKRNIHY